MVVGVLLVDGDVTVCVGSSEDVGEREDVAGDVDVFIPTQT